MSFRGEVNEAFARIAHIEQQTNTQPIGFNTIETTVVDPGVYVYYGTWVVSFGEAVIIDGKRPVIAKLWANGQLVYNGLNGLRKSGWRFTYYDGAEDQGPVMREMHYRGLLTVRFDNVPLTDYGDSIPAMTAEFFDGDGIVIGKLIQPAAYDAKQAISIQLNDTTVSRLRGTESTGLLTRSNAVAGDASVSTGEPTFSVPLAPAPSPQPDGPMCWFPEIARAVFVGSGGFVTGPVGSKRAALIDYNGQPTVPRHTWSLDQSVNSPFAFTPWTTMGRFVIQAGGVTRYYVAGFGFYNGVSVTPFAAMYGILNVTDIALRFSASGSNGDLDNQEGTRWHSVVEGERRNGATDVYLHTQDKIAKLTCTPKAGTDYELNVGEEMSWFTAPSGYPIITQIFYEKGANRVIALCSNDAGPNGKAVCINADGSVAWETDNFSLPVHSTFLKNGQGTSNLEAGSLVVGYYYTVDAVNYIDLETGDRKSIGIGSDLPNNTPVVWDSRINRLWTGNFSYIDINAPPDNSNIVAPSAAKVMRGYALRVGYDEVSEVKTFNMDHMPLAGYVVSSQMSITDLANSVGSLYGFNWFAFANEITFKSAYDADGNVIIDDEIDPDDIALQNEGASGTNKLAISRSNDNAAPAKITFSFFDIDNSFKNGTVKRERSGEPLPTHDSASVLDFVLPITMGAHQATVLIHAMMVRAWAQKVGFNFRLPSDYLTLTPVDAVKFAVDGFEYTGVISMARTNADHSLTLALSEAAGAVHPPVVEVQPPRVVAGASASPRVVIFEIPDIGPAYTQLGFYNAIVIAGGYTEGAFGGASVEIQGNGDVDFRNVLDFSGEDEGYVSRVAEAPEAWPDFDILDTLNNLVVEPGNIPASKFANATSAQLDANPLLNLIGIGKGSTVELIQFQTASRMSDGNWHLSDLRRGRFGTDTMQGLANSGDDFAFIEKFKVIPIDIQKYSATATGIDESLEGFILPIAFRYGNPRQPTYTFNTTNLTMKGNSRKPYAVLDIQMLDDAVNDAWVFRFVRRNRFSNTPPTPLTPLPVDDELYGEYFLELFNDSWDSIFTEHQAGDNSNPDYVELRVSKIFIDFPISLGDTLGIRIRQRASSLQLQGFAYPLTTVVVSSVDQVQLSARIDGGGWIDANITNEKTAITLAAQIDGEGSINADVRGPVTLEATIDGAGSLSGSLSITNQLAATIAGAGELSANLRNDVPWIVGIDGGGSLAASLAIVREAAATVEGGGAVSGHLQVTQRLAATMDGGGDVFGHLFPPHRVTGTISAGGAVSAHVQVTARIAATIGAGGAISADVDTTPAAFEMPQPERLMYWLKADDGVFVDSGANTDAVDGSLVQTWRNHGIKGDVIQPLASARPKFGDKGGLNGKPYIRVDLGSPKYFNNLEFTQPSGLTSFRQYTVFAVVTPNKDNGANVITGGDNGGTSGFTHKMALSTAENNVSAVRFITDGGTGAVGGSPKFANVLFATLGRNKANSSTGASSGRRWVRRNGIDIAAENDYGGSIVTYGTSGVQFLRVQYGSSLRGYFAGEIYEYILYEGLLTDAEIFQIENYLLQKYAVNDADNKVSLRASIGGGGTLRANAKPFTPPVGSDLRFWFKGDGDAFSDDAGTVLANDGDAVAVWKNYGSGANAIQATALNRPTYKRNGRNDRPYINAVAASAQFFADIAFTQAGGTTVIAPYTVFAVVDLNDRTAAHALFGSIATNGGKVGVYFRPDANAQFHFAVAATRRGQLPTTVPSLVTGMIGRTKQDPAPTVNRYERLWTRINSQDAYAEAASSSTLTTSTISATQFLRSTGLSGNAYFDGKLYEVMLFNGVLTDAQIFEIEDYLNKKYNLSGEAIDPNPPAPATAPTFVGTSSATSTDFTHPLTVPLPAGIAAGDVLVFAAKLDVTSGSVPTSTGGSTWVSQGRVNELHVFTTVATSGDVGGSVSLDFIDTVITSQGIAGVVSAYRKGTGATALAVQAGSVVAGTVAPSVTAVAATDLVVVGASTEGSNPLNVPDGYVGAGSAIATSGQVVRLSTGHRQPPANGATPTADFGGTGGWSGLKASFAVHLRQT